MKIMIAVPCMDYLEANFVESLLNLRQPEGCDVHTVLLKACLVYDSRNQAAKKAVEEGYDYVLWIDSDMTFESDLLERMLADIGDKPVLGVVCFGRRPPFNPTVYKRVDLKREGIGMMPYTENYFDYPRNSIFEAAGFGWACVLQRVDMLDTMLSVYGVPFFPLAGLGEDLSFCYRAAQLDYKFYADSSLKVGHIMRMSVDENFRDNVITNAPKEA